MISIRPFRDDIFDRGLWKLRSFFDKANCYDDMGDVVKHYIIVYNLSLVRLLEAAKWARPDGPTRSACKKVGMGSKNASQKGTRPF
ncbi:C-terminal domain small phosphatase [Spatholobus suberectus]|nr:C-terminal domain small phosphatase [Spatholobus suberectus]